MVGEHESRVEHAAIGHAVAAHAPRDRLEYVGGGSLQRIDAEPWHRRVGAHAAGVRTDVTGTQPLVVARGSQRDDGRVADQCEGTHLASGEPLLEHDGCAGSDRREQVAHGPLGLLAGFRHDDALAGGEPVGLHHRRSVAGADVCHGRLRIDEGRRCGGRDPGALHLAVREGLARLQPRGGPGRPEHRNARRHQLVRHASRQRNLGSHDHEVVALPCREARHGQRIGDVEVRGGRRHRRRSAVAWSNVDGAHTVVTGEAPGQGMLAGTGSEHQDVHRPECRCGTLRGARLSAKRPPPWPMRAGGATGPRGTRRSR